MKTFLSVAIAIILLLPVQQVSAQTKKSASPVIGTWKLASQTVRSKDTTINRDSTQIKQIKIVTPDRFMFMVLGAHNDSVLAAATGRVVLRGNNYTEVIEQTSIDLIKGKSYTYPVDVKGNKWYLKGDVNDWKLEEVWLKMDE